jgi:hypothetical protein
MGPSRRVYRFARSAPDLAVVRGLLEARLGTQVDLRVWEAGGGGTFSSRPRRARVDVQVVDSRVILEELLPLSEALFEELAGTLQDLGGVAAQ